MITVGSRGRRGMSSMASRGDARSGVRRAGRERVRALAHVRAHGGSLAAERCNPAASPWHRVADPGACRRREVRVRTGVLGPLLVLDDAGGQVTLPVRLRTLLAALLVHANRAVAAE